MQLLKLCKIGYIQGFKKGLKFANCSGITFLDNGWIAGVDENENQDEIDNEKNENGKVNEPEIKDIYDQEQQEVAETLHEDNEN